MERRFRIWGLAACAGILMAATAHGAAAMDFSTGLAADGVFVSITSYVRAVPHTVGIDMSNNALTEPATMVVLGTGLLALCRARGRQRA